MFIVIATKKYIIKYDKLLKYLSTFKQKYYIVLSGSETKINNNEILVNIEDIWENLSKKIILAIELIYKNTNYTHIYKVNDTFYELNLNYENHIYKYDFYGNYIINSLNKKRHFEKCNDNELNNLEYDNILYGPYPYGKYGYILSRKSMFIILNNKKYIENEIYEDKSISDVLFKNNIFINKTSYKKLKLPSINISLNKNLILEKNLEILPENKLAVIFYHKNIKKIYKNRWINKCINSILNQSIKNFDIFEINYGNESYSIFEDELLKNNKHFFFKKDYKTHIEAMTFLLNTCFCNNNYEIVFNTNLDDYYENNRFEEQIKCINSGYDLCSNLMNYIEDNDDNDIITKTFDLEMLNIKSNNYYVLFDEIKNQINKDNNIINHSSICFSRNFWYKYDKYNNLLRYRNDKPFEDLSLWKRALNNDIKITIINKILVNYRIHNNQIGKQKLISNKNINIDGGFLNKESTEIKRIGIYCICTGNYINFLEQLILSVQKNFLVEYNKIYFIVSDLPNLVEKICKKHKVNHLIKRTSKKGFPLDTLYRYNYLLDFDVEIEILCDVIYYLDVDMKINNLIDDDILPTKNNMLVVTEHPGFYNNNNATYEENINSTAYVNKNLINLKYIAGGFNGGITHYFLKMATEINNNIFLDKSKDIIAIWHDESHLNKYFIKNSHKFKILNHKYCYPESYTENNDIKIIALDKQHHLIRNNTKQKKIIINLKGGIGNNLFQIFFGYMVAFRYNLELCILNNINNDRESPFYYHLFDNIFRISNNEFITNKYEIKENDCNYFNYLNDIPFNSNVYVDGYFQSTLYFKEIFNRITNKLNFKILDIAKDIINNYKIKIKKQVIGLHIRGTDYISTSKYHYNLDDTYYSKILESLDLTNKEIILFTDDIDLVKNKFKINYNTTIKKIISNNINIEYKYLQNNPELEMFLLSLCDVIICANSTFSLWASYFSNNSKIFIPKKWFDINGPKDFKVEDLCLNNNFTMI